MRSCVLLSALIVLPCSAYGGSAECSAPVGMQESSEGYTITITPIDCHEIGFTDEILGMSFDDTGWPRILCISAVDDMLYSLEPLSADSIDALPLCASNQDGWGIAWLDETLLCANDRSDTWLYGHDSYEWFMEENAAGSDGRGMDYDNYLFGQAVSQESLHRVVSWDPMSGIWTWSDVSSWVPSELSGLTAFTRDSCSYVCVTTFDAAEIWVFRVEDREITEYIGNASLPAAATSSLGLCYGDWFDTFWWSYCVGSDDYLYRFEMDIDETSLEGTTWAGIKTVFR